MMSHPLGGVFTWAARQAPHLILLSSAPTTCVGYLPGPHDRPRTCIFLSSLPPRFLVFDFQPLSKLPQSHSIAIPLIRFSRYFITSLPFSSFVTTSPLFPAIHLSIYLSIRYSYPSLPSLRSVASVPLPLAHPAPFCIIPAFLASRRVIFHSLQQQQQNFVRICCSITLPQSSETERTNKIDEIVTHMIDTIGAAYCDVADTAACEAALQFRLASLQPPGFVEPLALWAMAVAVEL